MKNNQKYEGIRFNGGEKAYLWIPYKLRKFFKDSTKSDDDDKYSYNQIVLEGRYLYKNIREDILVENKFVKVIDLTEKELAMLD